MFLLSNVLGFGWVTILVGVVSAYGTIDGGWCDASKDKPCKTYVRIYINDKFMDQTKPVDGKFVYDADHQFVSSKIEKSAKIKIEVMYFGSKGEEFVLQSEGTIDNFMKHPYRHGDKLDNGIMRQHNSVNTYVLWEDEFA